MQEKPIKTEVLKKQLFVGRKLNKCWEFLESSGLISSNNGETFNENLLKFSEKFQVKKEKNRERISKWRENQALSENVTRYESVCNSPKDNISKVKVNKEDKSSSSGSDEPKKQHYFIALFNELTGRDFKVLDSKTEKQLAKLRKQGYGQSEFKIAITAGHRNSARWDSPQLFTPEYITRESHFVKYLYWDNPGNAPKPEAPKKQMVY